MLCLQESVCAFGCRNTNLPKAFLDSYTVQYFPPVTQYKLEGLKNNSFLYNKLFDSDKKAFTCSEFVDYPGPI